MPKEPFRITNDLMRDLHPETMERALSHAHYDSELADDMKQMHGVDLRTEVLVLIINELYDEHVSRGVKRGEASARIFLENFETVETLREL